MRFGITNSSNGALTSAIYPLTSLICGSFTRNINLSFSLVKYGVLSSQLNKFLTRSTLILVIHSRGETESGRDGPNTGTSLSHSSMPHHITSDGTATTADPSSEITLLILDFVIFSNSNSLLALF
ncbi:uncharacterized protein LOC142226137 [Haematobia irritans]|uniref:uncharacterized protein LOC142226137 n=1 Tax=Haematobia irritans TaxID=7368 RepID=UPI003F4F6C1C